MDKQQGPTGSYSTGNCIQYLVINHKGKECVCMCIYIYIYTLAWKIPWTEEPGRLQSMGSLRVRHD